MTEQIGPDGHPIPEVQGEVVAAGTVVDSKSPGLGQILEKAMVDAINWCLSQGITDPEMILAAKHKAFRDTKEAYEAHIAQARSQV